jgi:hypothetical protein
MENETPQLVRKHWSFIIAYCIVTSLTIGFIFSSLICLSWIMRGGVQAVSNYWALHLWLIIAGVISLVLLLIQLFTGEFIFTRDVVCQTCHRRQKLNRIPLFASKWYRVPQCECGGDLETAFFWELKP